MSKESSRDVLSGISRESFVFPTNAGVMRFFAASPLSRRQASLLERDPQHKTALAGKLFLESLARRLTRTTDKSFTDTGKITGYTFGEFARMLAKPGEGDDPDQALAKTFAQGVAARGGEITLYSSDDSRGLLQATMLIGTADPSGKLAKVHGILTTSQEPDPYHGQVWHEGDSRITGLYTSAYGTPVTETRDQYLQRAK